MTGSINNEKEVVMNTRITTRKWDDFHAHLRQEELLRIAVPHTAAYFERALVMPNIKPPVCDMLVAKRYRNEILDVAHRSGYPDFEPLMTIKIVDGMNSGTVSLAHAFGMVAGKAYPVGATTNSEEGVSDFRHPRLRRVFEEMEAGGMVLSVHGEMPLAPSLEREARFLCELEWLATQFPKLKIVMEHITTRKAVEAVCSLPSTVAATITVHHLFLTLDDVIGGKLNPHHFCKPIAKTLDDRAAVQEAAISGNPKFFFGSDSAPHRRENKECGAGEAGIFTSPVAPSLLAEFFESRESLHRLESFVSRFGAEFYGLPLNKGTITLIKEPWEVPRIYSSFIVPFKAGETLQWKVVERS